MGTTSGGLRFPEPEGRVNLGAQAIKDLANDVQAALNAAANPPRVAVYRNVDFNIANATTTQLNFNAETYDVGGLWTTGSANIITIPETGLYLIQAQVSWAPNASGVRSVYLYSDALGGYFAADSRTPASTASTMQSVATEVRLTAGDTVNLRVNQTSGGSLAVTTANGGVNMRVRKVAA